MYDEDSYGLTDDEKAAGVGELLQGRYDSPSRKYTSPRSRKSSLNYPSNHGAKWSEAEIESVKKLFKSGLSIQEVASIKERTAYAIAYRLHDSRLITFSQKESVKSGNSQIYYTQRRKTVTKPTNIQTSEPKIHLTNAKQEARIVSSPPKKTVKEKSSFFDVIKQNTTSFFTIWLIVLVINQVFIFNACFAPYCLIAALPHTGIISAVLAFIASKD